MVRTVNEGPCIRCGRVTNYYVAYGMSGRWCPRCRAEHAEKFIPTGEIDEEFASQPLIDHSDDIDAFLQVSEGKNVDILQKAPQEKRLRKKLQFNYKIKKNELPSCCPKCGSEDTFYVDGYNYEKEYNEEIECVDCGFRWITNYKFVDWKAHSDTRTGHGETMDLREVLDQKAIERIKDSLVDIILKKGPYKRDNYEHALSVMDNSAENGKVIWGLLFPDDTFFNLSKNYKE